MIEQWAQCREILSAAVVGFRLGMEGQASEKLVAFVDIFLPILQEGANIDIELVNGLLTDLLASQARKDFARVADILEYEIKPLLQR